ncbi:MAG TPA: hypothetical protein VF595_06635 [Tepidisphaeraceae bacterium]|jgi:hypothetical protein
MDDNFVHLRVIYDDLPDMIELAVDARHAGWVARSTAYASPDFFTSDASELIAWSFSPKSRFRMEVGADTGIGWLVLEFFTVDLAGHVRCSVQLATAQRQPGESWRCCFELPTELGLVERFGRECARLGDGVGQEARLVGVPA